MDHVAVGPPCMPHPGESRHFSRFIDDEASQKFQVAVANHPGRVPNSSRREFPGIGGGVRPREQGSSRQVQPESGAAGEGAPGEGGRRAKRGCPTQRELFKDADLGVVAAVPLLLPGLDDPTRQLPQGPSGEKWLSHRAGAAGRPDLERRKEPEGPRPPSSLRGSPGLLQFPDLSDPADDPVHPGGPAHHLVGAAGVVQVAGPGLPDLHALDARVHQRADLHLRFGIMTVSIGLPTEPVRSGTSRGAPTVGALVASIPVAVVPTFLLDRCAAGFTRGLVKSVGILPDVSGQSRRISPSFP